MPRRVIAVSNGKGGVGKTSLTAGLAGLAAAAGYAVLTIDTDPQGNLSRDLGYQSDDGRGLARSMQTGEPLQPIRGVRPGLDSVPGGQQVADIPAIYVARKSQGRELPGLGESLKAVRPEGSAHADYDLILVDTPPGDPMLQDLVLTSADYLIIPTRSDEASLDGLVSVAQRFSHARENNSKLTLLGVVLFGVQKRSTRLVGMVREALEDTLEGVAPVFDTTVRYLESAAVDMRRSGLLPHELEAGQGAARINRIERLRSGWKGRSGDDLFNRNASGLAGDYQELAREVLGAVADVEKRRADGLTQAEV